MRRNRPARRRKHVRLERGAGAGGSAVLGQDRHPHQEPHGVQSVYYQGTDVRGEGGQAV